MAAKTENSSPTKLSPGERLARKRSAARLRQQRCRARKRQALMEQRRQDQDVRVTLTQDSRTKPVQERQPQSTSHIKDLTKPPTTEPIYNVVSFDSLRSHEEAQRGHIKTSPKELCDHNRVVSLLPSTPETPKEAETSHAVPKKSEEPLVSEEEAAVAAMLSLKSGPKTKPSVPNKVPSSPPPTAVKERGFDHRMGAKFRYYRPWGPRRYESYDYMRQTPYYPMPAPRVPPQHFRYYPAYTKGHMRYNYEAHKV